MNTIVLNTLTGAVSEYDGFDFHAITPDHAGSVLGLYALGGDLDVAQPITSTLTTGIQTWGTTLKKLGDLVYIGMKGAGQGVFTVVTPTTSFSYTFPLRDTHQSRCATGRGIIANYLQYTLQNTAGADFQLDRIEIPTRPSATRRI